MFEVSESVVDRQSCRKPGGSTTISKAERYEENGRELKKNKDFFVIGNFLENVKGKGEGDKESL